MELPKGISKTFWSDFLTGGWPCLKLKGGLLCTSTEISDIHATCIAFPSFDKSIQRMVFWPVPSNQLFFSDFLIVLDTACLKGWLSSSKVQTVTFLSFHKSAQQMVVWHTGEKSTGTLLQRSSLITIRMVRTPSYSFSPGPVSLSTVITILRYCSWYNYVIYYHTYTCNQYFIPRMPVSP